MKNCLNTDISGKRVSLTLLTSEFKKAKDFRRAVTLIVLEYWSFVVVGSWMCYSESENK